MRTYRLTIINQDHPTGHTFASMHTARQHRHPFSAGTPQLFERPLKYIPRTGCSPEENTNPHHGPKRMCYRCRPHCYPTRTYRNITSSQRSLCQSPQRVTGTARPYQYHRLQPTDGLHSCSIHLCGLSSPQNTLGISCFIENQQAAPS